jgi:hypothetical protein
MNFSREVYNPFFIGALVKGQGTRKEVTPVASACGRDEGVFSSLVALTAPVWRGLWAGRLADRDLFSFEQIAFSLINRRFVQRKKSSRLGWPIKAGPKDVTSNPPFGLPLRKTSER